MVHIPAKFRQNTTMRFWVTVQKTKRDGQTDRQTDGGAFQYLPSQAFGAAGDNKKWESIVFTPTLGIKNQNKEV